MNNNSNFNFKQTMVDITVNCMLNPHNSDFYIGTLTFDKLHNLINNDSEKAEVVFTALGIAQAEFDLIFNHFDNYDSCGCPECGCSTYIDGCRCPNCDYED